MGRHRFSSLRTAVDHRRAHRAMAAMARHAGAQTTHARLQEGLLPTLLVRSHDLWLTQHDLANRHRNALGPGDPTGRGLVWPSVQLNLPLAPGSARPHARFLRATDGALWVAHVGALGGRQAGISRAGFVAFMAATIPSIEVDVDDRAEQLLLLGTFADPAALLDNVANLVHGAHAYRSAIAAGLR